MMKINTHITAESLNKNIKDILIPLKSLNSILDHCCLLTTKSVIFCFNDAKEVYLCIHEGGCKEDDNEAKQLFY